MKAVVIGRPRRRTRGPGLPGSSGRTGVRKWSRSLPPASTSWCVRWPPASTTPVRSSSRSSPVSNAVARLADGRRGYVGYARAPYGTISERTVIPAGWSLPIPEDSTVSDAVIAGSMNPMASVWMALVHRAELRPGERVLVLGATGASGRLAVALAEEFGAGSVIAGGRNHAVLQGLAESYGASTVTLSGDVEGMTVALAEVIADVDVVVDYVWGPVAEAAITAISRVNHGRRIRYVEVGAMAGPDIRPAVRGPAGDRVGDPRFRDGVGRPGGYCGGSAGSVGPGRVRRARGRGGRGPAGRGGRDVDG